MAETVTPQRKPRPIPIEVGPVIQPKNPKETRWTIIKVVLCAIALGILIWIIIFGRSGDRFSHKAVETAQGIGINATVNVENLTPLEENGRKFYRLWLHAGAAGSPTSFELCSVDVPYTPAQKEISAVLCPIPHPQKNGTGLLSLTIDYTHDENCSTSFVYSFNEPSVIDYYNEQVTRFFDMMISREPFSESDGDITQIEDIPDFLAQQKESWDAASSRTDPEEFPFLDFIGQKVCFSIDLINPYNMSVQRLAYNHILVPAGMPKTPEEIHEIVGSGSSDNQAEQYMISLIFKDQATYDKLIGGKPQQFPSLGVLNNNEQYTQWFNALKSYRICGYYLGNSYFYCTDVFLTD